MSFDHRTNPPEPESPSRHTEKIFWWTFGVTYISLAVALGWLGIPDRFFVFALWICAMLSKGVANWACRRAGVSQEGSWREIIKRNAHAALAPFLSEAPEFEIKAVWLPQARVDRQGIEARQSDGKWKRVAWRDVEACTFVFTRNVVGAFTGGTLTLHHSEAPPLQVPVTEASAQKLLGAVRFHLRGESA